MIYNSEWIMKRDNMYETIHNCIIYAIVDKYDFNEMINNGLTEYQRLYLMDILEKELIKFSNKQEWAENTTFNIIYGIQGFFKGFIKTNKWKYIFKSLEPIDLAEILFENIKWQLDDGQHIPNLLEEIIN